MKPIFIKLTSTLEDVFVNVDYIVSFALDIEMEGTDLRVINSKHGMVSVHIKETPERIIELINEASKEE